MIAITVLEVVELSALFAIPAVPIMLLVWTSHFCACRFMQRPRQSVLHWVDVVVPIFVTELWCSFQCYSFRTKSLGNLAEIGILGLIWGGLFLHRTILAFRNRRISIWIFVAVESAITIVSAVCAPTFPE